MVFAEKPFLGLFRQPLSVLTPRNKLFLKTPERILKHSIHEGELTAQRICLGWSVEEEFRKNRTRVIQERNSSEKLKWSGLASDMQLCVHTALSPAMERNATDMPRARRKKAKVAEKLRAAPCRGVSLFYIRREL